MIRCILAGAALALAFQPAAGALRDGRNTTSTPVASSSATIAGGTLEIAGTTAAIKNELVAAGSAPPAYSVKESAKSFRQSVPLPEDAELSLSAGTSTDTAVSKGQHGDTVTSTASSSIKLPSASLTVPLVPGTLAVTATNIQSTAEFVKSTGKAPVASGTATLSGLKMNLSILGLGVFDYTGKPKPNTLLFKAKTGR